MNLKSVITAKCKNAYKYVWGYARVPVMKIRRGRRFVKGGKMTGDG